MRITKVTCVFFSATGLTEKTANVFLSALALPCVKWDVTPFSQKDKTRVFGPDELVVFSAPVYGGRIPVPAAERFEKMRGRNTPAVCLAVYGNRAYEDALSEMRDLAVQGGFIPVAFAASVAQHSIMRRTAFGRPDGKDREKITSFARGVWNKLEKASALTAADIPSIGGCAPYRVFKGIALKPSASSSCVKCGACVERCPVGAISASAPDQTDKTRCISCMACVSACPKNARGINKLVLWLAGRSFERKYGKRREPDFFL